MVSAQLCLCVNKTGAVTNPTCTTDDPRPCTIQVFLSYSFYLCISQWVVRSSVFSFIYQYLCLFVCYLSVGLPLCVSWSITLSFRNSGSQSVQLMSRFSVFSQLVCFPQSIYIYIYLSLYFIPCLTCFTNRHPTLKTLSAIVLEFAYLLSFSLMVVVSLSHSFSLTDVKAIAYFIPLYPVFVCWFVLTLIRISLSHVFSQDGLTYMHHLHFFFDHSCCIS